MLQRTLSERLKKRKEENSLRKLTHQSNLIDFTSNDYLGLAHSEELFRLIADSVDSLPHRNGATGSRLLSGNHSYTEEVERKLAGIFKSEATLIFNSGYAANQAVLSSLPQKGDTIIYDERAHACIRDGARLSFASRHSFSHNDLTNLEHKLRKSTGNIFIVVESIYSMDGDQCPLVDIISLANKYEATIILDEAHSTGVLGAHGAGLAVSLELADKIPVRIYTFGKAMGVHGACVAGSHTLIDYLINFARTFIFTTALAPHSIASIDCAFQYLSTHINLQQELRERINIFNSESENQNLKKLNSNTQIQAIVIPGNEDIRKIAASISAKGFDVRPILSPTVAKGSERLRICLHTFNTDEEIKQLIRVLSKV